MIELVIFHSSNDICGIMDSLWTWAAICSAGVGVLLLKRYMNGPVFKSNVDLSGKTVVVTGGNCGIGKATAQELCKLGARVVIACRNISKGEKAASDMRQSSSKGQVLVRELNLASFESIREFVVLLIKEEGNIDILVINAAVYQCQYDLTEDGIEMQMGVNYLGHFLLTNLLMDRLKHSHPARVVIVSSALAKRGRIELNQLSMTKENYDKKAGYNNSKLACNYFSRELSRRVEGSGVHVYCVSPGMVSSSLGRHVHVPLWLKILIAPIWLLMVKSCYHGAQTVVYCAAAETLEEESGLFYRNLAAKPYPEDSNIDEEEERKLWEISSEMVGL